MVIVVVVVVVVAAVTLWSCSSNGCCYMFENIGVPNCLPILPCSLGPDHPVAEEDPTHGLFSRHSEALAREIRAGPGETKNHHR